MIDSFEDAVKKRDGEAMMDILTRVDASGPEAAGTTTAILTNPTKYGY